VQSRGGNNEERTGENWRELQVSYWSAGEYCKGERRESCLL
jgi:hypothetical protein